VSWVERLCVFVVIFEISTLSSFIGHKEYRSITDAHSTKWYMIAHSVLVSMVALYYVM